MLSPLSQDHGTPTIKGWLRTSNTAEEDHDDWGEYDEKEEWSEDEGWKDSESASDITGKKPKESESWDIDFDEHESGEYIKSKKKRKPRITFERKKSVLSEEASLVINQEARKCRICFGVIKKGLTVIKCSCGKIYHASCGVRVGECPGCSWDFSELEHKLEEEDFIENAKDSRA